jgi:hypothetical protein
MKDDKRVWRITPCLGDGNEWMVKLVCLSDLAATYNGQVYGTFRTLKAAKAAVAHMNRKPIDIKYAL